MKHRLSYAEINITNVCNYSCTHCQSLNNFAFKGHQLWEDYKDQYQLLSNRIDIDTIQIIGGEPTANPDFKKWVEEISNLWPNSKLQISTNGTRLEIFDRDIYKILQRHRGTLWITCHDINLYNKQLNFAKEFLDNVIEDYNPDPLALDNWQVSYNLIKQKDWPECNSIDQFDQLPSHIKQQFTETIRSQKNLPLRTVPRILIDSNYVEVKLDWSQAFVSSAISLADQQAKLKYNSDPVQAHSICHYKTCHQINKGKIYKCPLVSVLPDFLNQFSVNCSDQDKIIAQNYQPLTGLESDQEITEFIKNINQPISQCKFCPSEYKKYNFVGTDKKIKIKVIGPP